MRLHKPDLLDHLVGGREQLVRHGGYVDRILKGEKNTASPSSPLVTPGITSGHPDNDPVIRRATSQIWLVGASFRPKD